MSALLTRDQFREQTLARNPNGACPVPGCTAPATDAHHILNRNLFHGEHEHGGYFLTNGAGLCGPHHLDAERTLITVEDLRTWCGITDPTIPEHLDPDTAYDTWGNPIIDGTRLPGEMFYDPGCQAALTSAGVLWQVSPYVKYPRTFHLPWSPGATDDDKTQHDLSALTGRDVVITLKMDGEATTIYPDGYSHARSLTAKAHPSRDHIRALAATIAHDIPAGYRLCGENLWATHSIAYTKLPAAFLLYSVWDRGTCLSWDETVEWAALLDLHTVPVLYRGPMPATATALDALFAPHQDTHEGYVVRPAAGFNAIDFTRSVLKWVRANHVTTDQHWMNGPVRRNGIAKPLP